MLFRVKLVHVDKVCLQICVVQCKVMANNIIHMVFMDKATNNLAAEA